MRLNTSKQSLDFYDTLIVTVMVAAFTPVFCRLMTLGWIKADYTHAYFLGPISAWLIYQKRDVLTRRDDVSPLGAVLFAAGVLSYAFSILNGFMFLEAASFVLTVWGIFALRFTARSNTQIIFPLAYLALMIPPPFLVVDTVTMPLKNVAMMGSYFLLKLSGLPVSLHGAILRVGDYDFFVADACSGYRSMVTLIALGALYAHWQKTTAAKKWAIFLSVIPLAIAGNIFRIFITGVLGHAIGVQYAEGFFHEFSGAVVFLVAVLGLMFVTDRLTGTHGR